MQTIISYLVSRKVFFAFPPQGFLDIILCCKYMFADNIQSQVFSQTFVASLCFVVHRIQQDFSFSRGILLFINTSAYLPGVCLSLLVDASLVSMLSYHD